MNEMNLDRLFRCKTAGKFTVILFEVKCLKLLRKDHSHIAMHVYMHGIDTIILENGSTIIGQKMKIYIKKRILRENLSTSPGREEKNLKIYLEVQP